MSTPRRLDPDYKKLKDGVYEPLENPMFDEEVELKELLEQEI